MKRAFILIEVSAETDEELRAKVGAIRRPLTLPDLAHLPFYEDRGPMLQEISPEGKDLYGSMTNHWTDFAWLFDNLPWRSSL